MQTLCATFLHDDTNQNSYTVPWLLFSLIFLDMLFRICGMVKCSMFVERVLGCSTLEELYWDLESPSKLACYSLFMYKSVDTSTVTELLWLISGVFRWESCHLAYLGYYR